MRRLLISCLLLLLSASLEAQEVIARFTVDVMLRGTGVDTLEVQAHCGPGQAFSLALVVPVDASSTFTVPVAPDAELDCTISVSPVVGQRLTFLGDGKKLLAPLRITGRGKPQAVRIPLTGVKSLVIRLDYGKDQLDVGDHVDFAGARLIK